jgi:small-conductance mechanosensitive channel
MLTRSVHQIRALRCIVGAVCFSVFLYNSKLLLFFAAATAVLPLVLDFFCYELFTMLEWNSAQHIPWHTMAALGNAALLMCLVMYTHMGVFARECALSWFVVCVLSVARHHLLCKLSYTGPLQSTVNRALRFLCGFVSLIAFLVIFGAHLLEYYSLILSTFVAMGIIFGSSLSRICESFLFLFAEHSFSQGDMITLCSVGVSILPESTMMTVKEIRLMSTTCVLQDSGSSIILPNRVLQDCAVIHHGSTVKSIQTA